MEILDCLNKSKSIKNYEILDFKSFENGFYIKIKAIIINNTELFIREYTDEKERSYSYHWQDENKNLILRWDNAPHHSRIVTFPHHKHVKEKVKENFNIDCFSIIKEISSLI